MTLGSIHSEFQNSATVDTEAVVAPAGVLISATGTTPASRDHDGQHCPANSATHRAAPASHHSHGIRHCGRSGGLPVGSWVRAAYLRLRRCWRDSGPLPRWGASVPASGRAVSASRPSPGPTPGAPRRRRPVRRRHRRHRPRPAVRAWRRRWAERPRAPAWCGRPRSRWAPPRDRRSRRGPAARWCARGRRYLGSRSLSHARIGVATKIDEYAPVIRPMSNARAKSSSVDGAEPERPDDEQRRAPGSRATNDVLNERISTWLSDRFTMSRTCQPGRCRAASCSPSPCRTRRRCRRASTRGW